MLPNVPAGSLPFRSRFGAADAPTAPSSRNTSMPPPPGLFALSRLIGDAMFSGPGAPSRPVVADPVVSASQKSSALLLVSLGMPGTVQPEPAIQSHILRK